jgi:hypothetical protein
VASARWLGPAANLAEPTHASGGARARARSPRGRWNVNWRRVTNPSGKVRGGETHRGGMAPLGRWVPVAMAALEAMVELRWMASAGESPWSTKSRRRG